MEDSEEDIDTRGGNNKGNTGFIFTFKNKWIRNPIKFKEELKSNAYKDILWSTFELNNLWFDLNNSNLTESENLDIYMDSSEEADEDEYDVDGNYVGVNGTKHKRKRMSKEEQLYGNYWNFNQRDRKKSKGKTIKSSKMSYCKFNIEWIIKLSILFNN